MLYSIYGFGLFGSVMFIMIPLFLPFMVFWLFRMKRISDAVLSRVIYGWAWLALSWAKISLTVKGRENLPSHKRIVFICNHQGLMDIPSLLKALPYFTGFIAKKQLAYIPLLNVWMYLIHCIFFERKNIRAGLKAIQQGAMNVRKGYPMAIFPEGTRSRSNTVGTFKKGSLKLATMSQATIVPVTIQGTWHNMEEHGVIRPARVLVKFHPPVEQGQLTPEEQAGLSDRIREIILSGFEHEFD